MKNFSEKSKRRNIKKAKKITVSAPAGRQLRRPGGQEGEPAAGAEENGGVFEGAGRGDRTAQDRRRGGGKLFRRPGRISPGSFRQQPFRAGSVGGCAEAPLRRTGSAAGAYGTLYQLEKPIGYHNQAVPV